MTIINTKARALTRPTAGRKTWIENEENSEEWEQERPPLKRRNNKWQVANNILEKTKTNLKVDKGNSSRKKC